MAIKPIRALLACALITAATLVLFLGRGLMQPAHPASPTDEGPIASRAQSSDAWELAAPEGIPNSSSDSPRIAQGGTRAEPAKDLQPQDLRGLTLALHGFVIDERTGEPVPDLVLSAGAQRVETDHEGHFGHPDLVAEHATQIEVFDLETLLAVFPSSELVPDPNGGWRLPIGIGPTYRLRIIGAGKILPHEWQVGLVESAFERRDRSWGFQPLRAGEPTFVRFPSMRFEPHADYSPRLVLRRTDGTRGGEVSLETTVGVHRGVLLVELTERLGVLGGRVIDELGRPVRGTLVRAVPTAGEFESVDPRGWVEDRSTAEGEYTLEGLRPGKWWLSARPLRGEDPQVAEAFVPPGRSRAPDFVFPVRTPVGAVRGRLENETGGDFPATLVRLRALDGRDFDLLREVDPRASSLLRFNSPSAFVFREVPEGEYELEVVPLDGSTWSPSTLQVSPPIEGIVFTRVEKRTEELVFRVFDAATGETITEIFTQFQADHFWYPGAHAAHAGEAFEMAIGSRFRWNVHAHGYALASGDQDDFVPRGTGPREATLRLERGWGARLLLRDNLGQFSSFDADGWREFLVVLQRPPVVRAEVFVDGELAATSDENGVVELRLDREPRRIEVRKAGWRTLGSEHFRAGRLVGDPRELVVWMTRLGGR